MPGRSSRSTIYTGGVEFVGTQQGVDLTGVPQPDTVRRLLEGKGIQVRVPAK